MSLSMLLAWWNLVYLVPFALALLYLGLLVFTGIGLGETEADFSASVDGAAAADAFDGVPDGSADLSGDVAEEVGGGEPDAIGVAGSAGHLAQHPHGLDAAFLSEGRTPAGSRRGLGRAALAAVLFLLGVERIPLSLGVMIFVFCFGIIGFAINCLILGWGWDPEAGAWIGLPGAAGISLGVTGLVSSLLGRLLPSGDGVGQRRIDLLGKAGEAVYEIDASFGMVHVRGDGGDLFQVPCRAGPGQPPIPKGTRVVLFDYDREQGAFQVAPCDG